MTFTVILFVFGVVIGSFLNVVGLRFNSGVSLGGRSHCQSCGKVLRTYELVPILSFLFSLGRCRGCKSKVSWQYPLIEVFTGLVFVTLYQLPYPLLVIAIFIIVFCIYIVIFIYDWRHRIIPDSLSYAATILALVARILMGGTILDWFAGPILFAFFGSIWLLSRGRAMGFGDAKLSLSIGLLVGAQAGFSGIILAFWIGAIYGVGAIIITHSSGLLRKGKRVTMKSEVPFAPFIILATWASLIFHLNLIHVPLF